MKISTALVAAFVAIACLFQPTTAETEASTLLRVSTNTQGAICYKACPTGQYCPRGETNCRAPTGDLCFNPATSLFQKGCDLGFKCSNGKCVHTTALSSAHGPICYMACPTGQYCPRGETECRAPTGDLCFNPATSLFQHGCDAGFKCSNGKCVYKTTAAATAARTSPAHGSICYKACPTGQYCPRGETECRAPTGDLCFNPSTSVFQHGCGRGFKCSHGKCVYQ